MQEQSEPQFLFGIKIPWHTRMWIIAILLISGILVQLTLSFLVGTLIFLAGCLFGIPTGRKVTPVISGRGEWQTTTMEGLRMVLAIRNRIDRWASRTGTFNPSDIRGCCSLFLLVIVLVAGAAVIASVVDGGAAPGSPAWEIGKPFVSGGPLWPVWAADLSVLAFLLWFAGQVSAWRPDELVTKIDQLLFVAREAGKDPHLEIIPSLEVAKGEKGDVPTDARLLVKLKGAPEDFIGIQVQTSLNDVQGTKHPYTYCVMLARRGFGLTDRLAPHIGGRREGQFEGRIVEIEREKDMDVAVVRQLTSGGGYRTSEKDAIMIFKTSLRLARLAIS